MPLQPTFFLPLYWHMRTDTTPSIAQVGLVALLAGDNADMQMPEPSAHPLDKGWMDRLLLGPCKRSLLLGALRKVVFEVRLLGAWCVPVSRRRRPAD